MAHYADTRCTRPLHFMHGNLMPSAGRCFLVSGRPRVCVCVIKNCLQLYGNTHLQLLNIRTQHTFSPIRVTCAQLGFVRRRPGVLVAQPPRCRQVRHDGEPAAYTHRRSQQLVLVGFSLRAQKPQCQAIVYGQLSSSVQFGREMSERERERECIDIACLSA